jgi:glycosyltransferase involved in cell wall biosynthesis
MPVYDRVDPSHLDEAIESILAQTLRPSEIVLVRDGPLDRAQKEVISKWSKTYPELFHGIKLGKNRGVAQALQIGLEACSNALVGRMDADDINVRERFEKQVIFMDQNPQAHVLGAWIGEFDASLRVTKAVRKVPSDPHHIAALAPIRCPLNHMTVMYRKEAVMACGGYDDRFRGIEDYHLWAKMLMRGFRMYNLPEILIHVRATDDLYRRRGGWTYARVELLLQREFLAMGFCAWGQFMVNAPARLLVRLLPNRVRALIYSRLLRQAPL